MPCWPRARRRLLWLVRWSGSSAGDAGVAVRAHCQACMLSRASGRRDLSLWPLYSAAPSGLEGDGALPRDAGGRQTVQEETLNLCDAVLHMQVLALH